MATVAFASDHFTAQQLDTLAASICGASQAPAWALADSVAEPYMTVELQVLGQSVVDEDHPYRSAFASDEEALQLWDAIIESLRPRPGAASPGQ
ncbi:T6SS immunity protein Tli4 family protein [Stenotrophomonas sp. MMGLT7]|uniref:T6SS immunity protein Tli4 family protein n=1 Tax=Stenotrophomonas sp. MMGLT7 TaxID=2901227 RepID=UPI001E34B8D6|nr:T6SS immunity protein Tli4 family protein [Stenotrophomonas sp. MMGLT7]MCD7100155.1 hypothetical protein [Stenotrophomonas sp. MMGLT7]